MSKVQLLIEDATAYIDGEEIPGRSLVAIALLMQADLELKLEEREERRRGLASEVAKRLEYELPLLDAPGDPRVIPTLDGSGLVISGWPHSSGHSHALVRVWLATAAYRKVGWKFRFYFHDAGADCDSRAHVPFSQEAPFCQNCGMAPAK